LTAGTVTLLLTVSAVANQLKSTTTQYNHTGIISYRQAVLGGRVVRSQRAQIIYQRVLEFTDYWL
jgi:hypothetical protein